MSYNQNEVLHFQIYEKVFTKFTFEEFEDVVMLSDPVCKSLDAIDNLNRAIWFHRAVSLNRLEQSTEAIVILNKLVELYPLEPFYRKHLGIALDNFEWQTVIRYVANTDDTFEGCVKLLEDYHFVPWNIRLIHFQYLALKSRFKELSKILNNYLDLSPFDFDYLSVAFQWAIDIKDNELLKRILSIFDSIPQNHIDRIRVDGLMFGFFDSAQGELL